MYFMRFGVSNIDQRNWKSKKPIITEEIASVYEFNDHGDNGFDQDNFYQSDK